MPQFGNKYVFSFWLKGQKEAIRYPGYKSDWGKIHEIKCIEELKKFIIELKMHPSDGLPLAEKLHFFPMQINLSNGTFKRELHEEERAKESFYKLIFHSRQGNKGEIVVKRDMKPHGASAIAGDRRASLWQRKVPRSKSESDGNWRGLQKDDTEEGSIKRDMKIRRALFTDVDEGMIDLRQRRGLRSRSESDRNWRLSKETNKGEIVVKRGMKPHDASAIAGDRKASLWQRKVPRSRSESDKNWRGLKREIN
jgi:hypothetical protein